jgi:hypothetical protein
MSFSFQKWFFSSVAYSPKHPQRAPAPRDAAALDEREQVVLLLAVVAAVHVALEVLEGVAQQRGRGAFGSGERALDRLEHTLGRFVVGHQQIGPGLGHDASAA